MRRFTAFVIVLSLIIYASAEYRVFLLDQRVANLELYADQTTKVLHRFTALLTSTYEVTKDKRDCQCKH